MPLCGKGVVSFIDKILKPLACNALSAVSLPDPGPFISTDKTFIPISNAFTAAESAAICAAYGVDFLDPLNPFWPEEAQDITFPSVSAIETIVLLNVDWTYAIPFVIIFFVFFFFEYELFLSDLELSLLVLVDL